MSSRIPNQQPSPPPVSNTVDDGGESGSIHPITWMAIGGGLIGAVVVLAVLLGFFDRRPAPAVANAPAAAIGEKEPDSVASAAPSPTTSSTESKTANEKRGRIVWDDESTEQGLPSETSNDWVSQLRDETPANEPVVASDGKQTAAMPAAKPWENDPLAPAAKPLSPEDLYEQVAPSVVTIKVKDENEEHIATGSGFFIDEQLLSDAYKTYWLEFDKSLSKSSSGPSKQSAYVLTNYHVMRPAVSADIILLNGGEGSVERVIAEDEHADLVLLRVYVPANKSGKGIPLARDDPRVLATVYAIGSPKGLSGSASEGKVSSFRELPEGGHWLQTTAPISRGSSGGPLVLADGTLVGITTLSLKDAQNLNFAVPVSKVRSFLSSEYRGRAVAKGASFRWDLGNAHDVAGAKCEKSDSNDVKNAGQLLKKARQELSDAASNESDKKLAHYKRAVALAQQAEPALPTEFNYLVHYTIGTASLFLAYETSRNKTGDAATFRARYRASSDAQSAYRHLLKATQLKPEFAPALDMLRLHYGNSGNWPDALLAANSFVKLMPRCAAALQARAGCYAELGQRGSAKDDLEAAIELAPRMASLHYNLSEQFFALSEYTQAVESAEKALELGFDNKFLGYSALGDACRSAGNFRKAIAAYEMAKAAGASADYCDAQIAFCEQQLR